MLDELAKVFCGEWGYDWDGDPDEDDQVIPEKPDGSERPSKECFRRAVRAVLTRLMQPGEGMIEKLQELCAGDDINTECWTFLKRYRAFLRSAMEE